MTDTLAAKGAVAVKSGGVMGVGGVEGVRSVATFHLWQMPPISDWQQLPGWEVFINLLLFFFLPAEAKKIVRFVFFFFCLSSRVAGQPSNTKLAVGD